MRAKDLEIDSVSEKGQSLLKGASTMRSSGPELTTKYQQIFNKVKEINKNV